MSQKDEYDELLERCNKMSFLLGIVTGCLIEFTKDKTLSKVEKKPMMDLLRRVSYGIDELYYNRKSDDN